ncbi:flagellar hook-length control protein FliK [Rhodobacteraceae bacterium]|nr:flagellar hook-length control protein FliK [Paracoccaceae bacterium]
MSIANISSNAIDKLLSAASEEPPVGSKGAALLAKFSELMTTGEGADHGGNPEQKQLTDSELPNALQSGDEIDIVAFLGFVAALEDQVSRTPDGEGMRASAPELSGEDVESKDLARPFIADPGFVMMRDKIAQAMPALADNPQAFEVPSLNGLLPYLEAFHRHSSDGVNKEPQTAVSLPVSKDILRLGESETMVRTQHTAYPNKVADGQPMTKFLMPVELSIGEAMPPKHLPVQPEKLRSSKRVSMPLEPLSAQSGKAALVDNDAQLFEPITGKSAKPELGSVALAVTGLKENLERTIATPSPATPVKEPETAGVVTKSVSIQAADAQTDAKRRSRVIHQIPQVDPEKGSALRQRAAGGLSPAGFSKDNAPHLPSTSSSARIDPAAGFSKDNASHLPPAPSLARVDPAVDLEIAPKLDGAKPQMPEGQQKELVKPSHFSKPETTLKPEQIALRAASASASASASAVSSNDLATPSKINAALETSVSAGATPLQKVVEAEFKPKADAKGTTTKIQKPPEQSKADPAARTEAAAAAAQRQAVVTAVASDGGADAAQDLGTFSHSISTVSNANPQLAQTQTAPQASGQLLDKWVDSHLNLNARGWTQTLARNVISALRTGQQQIALTLSPVSLGKMHIAFGRNESGLDVKIQAERKATVSLFGESEGKIISSLETAGYRVTSLSCSVMQTSDENFNMNLGQGFNEKENPKGDERSQTAQKNEQQSEKEADDVSFKGKGDQDGLVDITI